jgi:hypothetical protein
MIADVQMQVWLDTIPGSVPAVVVPYVRTDRDVRLSYRIRLVKSGPSGSSSIVQSGAVEAQAGTPRELSKVSVASQPGDACRIEIEMRDGANQRQAFRFDCPR